MHISAEHNGYDFLDSKHQRDWDFTDDCIHITDRLRGSLNRGKVYLHLSPSLRPKLIGNAIVCEHARIEFGHALDLKLIPGEIPDGFNRFKKNHRIEASFTDQVDFKIIIH